MNAPSFLFAQTASKILSPLKGDEFVETWFQLKMEFFRLFQYPFIFSTRVTGPDFFDLIVHHLGNRKLLVAEDGGKLGEYDENFNKWLKANFNSSPS